MSTASGAADIRHHSSAEVPLYARIRTRLRLDIASGRYAQGEHLPPADQLGREYGANKNTILRALRMLRSEGVVDFGRGRGVVVLPAACPVGLDDLSDQLQRVVNLADVSGIPRAAIISAIERMPRVAARHGRAHRGPRGANHRRQG
ncbi:winged helix-turn-helix domain-containing protein [Streptomyces sp. NPDC005908]|uniref:GntR family transcriptional regulator n=1 Tax=unclassified Streptomyces TaxID=2593676 RepID=UPI0011A10C31|nr:winged helix-turn-helix domain-containing protein [Streptomyces sp. T12]TWD18591.1 GntR family transcriptional regulator [Streptomyces sp. T12]